MSLSDVASNLSNLYTIISGPSAIVMAVSMYFRWAREQWANRALPTVVCGGLGLLLVCDFYVRGYFDPLFKNQLEVVADKTFYAQKVILDGHDFRHCVFRNSTLIYNGGNVGMQNSQLFDVLFDSDVPEIRKAYSFMYRLGLTKPTINPDGTKVQ